MQTLQSTGLFKSVRPMARQATILEAPAFRVVRAPGGGIRVQMVPPLGSLEYIVTPRALPAIAELRVRIDSSLSGASGGPEQSQLESICNSAVEATRSAGSSLTPLEAYLQMRSQIKAACGDQEVVVSFSDVETGAVEVAVRAARQTDAAFISGLEASAVNGDGWGIDVFRPSRNVFQISKKFFIDVQTLDAMKAAQLGLDAPDDDSNASVSEHASSNGAGHSGEQGSGGASNGVAAGSAAATASSRVPFRPWSADELEAQAGPPDLSGMLLADLLAGLLTRQYAKQQAKAARRTGVSPGAAWRAAMEAASSAGTRQVLLLDMPSRVAERKLADSMFEAVGWRLGVGLAGVAAALYAAATTSLVSEQVEVAGVVGSFALAAALLAPVFTPLAAIGKLAEMKGEEVEAAVATQEPLQVADGNAPPLRLWGEDALLDWPGALRPLLHERDAWMSKGLAAAASQRPCGCPAFVMDHVDGVPVWRYMVPEGGEEVAAPAGAGDGAYQPLPSVRRVVAVVGMAHARGMARSWQDSLKDSDVSQLLQDIRR